MEYIVRQLISPSTAFGIAIAVTSALLVGAHLFEHVGGLAPCILCLDQREAHWVALWIAVLAVSVGRFLGQGQMMFAGLGALMVVYLFSTGLAGYHAGVEWGFWDGPAACAAGGVMLDVSASDILGSLDAAGPSGPPCETAAWRLFGISMAGYNALASAGLAIITGIGCHSAVRNNGPVTMAEAAS